MFVYGDPLVDETIKKWEAEKEKDREAKQNRNTKRQQPANSNQRSTNSRQQPAGNESQPANGNPQSTNSSQQAPNSSQQSAKKQPDSAEKTKVIEGARELFKHLHTNAVADELNIKKEQIFAEAQRLWGPSDNWTLDRWEEYIKAIADFHNRQGVIYDNLKPKDNASDTAEAQAA